MTPELRQGIEDVVCLIDDILVICRDQQEHDSRLHAVLRRLQEANVTLNDKLEISEPGIKYIGYLMSAAGIKPGTQILTWHHLKTSQKLGAFSEW